LISHCSGKTPDLLIKINKMKKLFVLVLTYSFYGAFAQTDSVLKEKKPKQFVASINTSTGKVDRGLIYQLDDSAITIKTLPGLKTNFSSKTKRDKYSLNRYAQENIESISIKRNNAKKRGALIGAGVGLVAGVVMGFASGDDPIYAPPAEDFFGIGALFTELNNAFAMTAGEKALAYGSIGALGGSIAGLIIGAIAKKRFIINGNKQKFEAMKLSVLERTY
jgi:hypothetical protein